MRRQNSAKASLSMVSGVSTRTRMSSKSSSGDIMRGGGFAARWRGGHTSPCLLKHRITRFAVGRLTLSGVSGMALTAMPSRVTAQTMRQRMQAGKGGGIGPRRHAEEGGAHVSQRQLYSDPGWATLPYLTLPYLTYRGGQPGCNRVYPQKGGINSNKSSTFSG